MANVVNWDVVPSEARKDLRESQEDLLVAFPDVQFHISFFAKDNLIARLCTMNQGPVHVFKEDRSFGGLEYPSPNFATRLGDKIGRIYRMYDDLFALLGMLHTDDDDVLCEVFPDHYTLRLHLDGPLAQEGLSTNFRLGSELSDRGLMVDGKKHGFRIRLEDNSRSIEDDIGLNIAFNNPLEVDADRLAEVVSVYNRYWHDVRDRDSLPPRSLDEEVVYMGLFDWDGAAPHLWLPRNAKRELEKIPANLAPKQEQVMTLGELDGVLAPFGQKVELAHPYNRHQLLSARRVDDSPADPTAYLLAARTSRHVELMIGYFPTQTGPRFLERFMSFHVPTAVEYFETMRGATRKV